MCACVKQDHILVTGIEPATSGLRVHHSTI